MSKSKFLLILLLIGIIPTILAAATNDTPAGTVITNEVTASFSNTMGNIYYATDAINTNVYAIYGISSIVTNTTNIYTAPGNTVTFHGYAVNEGNTSQIVYFTNLMANYGGGASGWTVQFQNDGMNNATSMTLTEDQGRDFYFQVTVPGSALFGHTMTNEIATIFTNTYRFTSIGAYTGLNGTNYAGTGQSAGRICITIIQAPVIVLTKLTYVSNSSTYLSLGGGLRDVVPGSEITYAVQFTNSGNTDALNLTLSDPLTANMTYIGNSMKVRTGLQTDASPASYNNAAALALSDANDVENVGAYQCNGNSNAGSGPIEFTFTAAIPSGGSGTVYFKVYIK